MATTVTDQPRSAKAAQELLNSRPIRKVAILGANGTMGFQSAALFTLAGIEVVFLARTKEKAEEGLAAAQKGVRSSTVAEFASTGSYDKDLQSAVADADIVFEALAENFAIKKEMFDKVEQWRRPGSIVATVTSGLSITKLAEGRGEDFQKNFIGLHFFNPPNVIVGTELIAGDRTDPELVEFLDVFCTKRLGRIMIRTADTPGFAGNRVGFKVLNECAQLAEQYNPVLIDKLVGPYTGRAMSPLATIDLVGWDVHKAIVDNVVENAKGDEAIDTVKIPAYMDKLIAGGTLGNKSGGGFFKRGTEKLVLDIKTGDYYPAGQVQLPNLKFIKDIAFLHHIGEYKQAMQLFAKAEGDEAALARKVIAGYISYSFCRVGEVTETITGIDLIMGSGFNWAPPGLLTDLIGIPETIRMIEQAGVKVPPVLEQAAKAGRKEPFFADPRLNKGKFFVAR
jgi:3-hydroxyacyl-CoA dehydrogenase